MLEHALRTAAEWTKWQGLNVHSAKIELSLFTWNIQILIKISLLEENFTCKNFATTEWLAKTKIYLNLKDGVVNEAEFHIKVTTAPEHIRNLCLYIHPKPDIQMSKWAS